MKLQDLDLTRIVPEFMQGDACVKALIATIEPLVKDMAANMRRVSIWADIDNLTESELDQLAVEMDIPWYNNTYAKSKKIKIIREGEKLIKKMGTPYALEYVIQEIFGYCTIKESGIDYPGEPYKFTITVDNGANLNQETYGRFVYLLGKIKRASSWIDSVGSSYSAEMEEFKTATAGQITIDRAELDTTGYLGFNKLYMRQAAKPAQVYIDTIKMSN